MKNLCIVAIATLLAISCKKESAADFGPNDKGSIELEFDNVFGSDDLQLNTATYTNALDQSINITTLNYFISNIRLKTNSGTEYVVPKDDSYFLITEANETSQKIELDDVPAGDYTLFTFTVGIDSLKSVAPVAERKGSLDPEGAAGGMYWNLNSGYIFMKLEGSSPAASTAGNKFQYHVGGFGGYDAPPINNIKTVTIKAPFEMVASVRKNKTHPPAVHIFADASKIFNGSTNISIAEYPVVELSQQSLTIANNYAAMFNIDHIHSD